MNPLFDVLDPIINAFPRTKGEPRQTTIPLASVHPLPSEKTPKEVFSEEKKQHLRSVDLEFVNAICYGALR
jgi:hypothetical protein